MDYSKTVKIEELQNKIYIIDFLAKLIKSSKTNQSQIIDDGLREIYLEIKKLKRFDWLNSTSFLVFIICIVLSTSLYIGGVLSFFSFLSPYLFCWSLHYYFNYYRKPRIEKKVKNLEDQMNLIFKAQKVLELTDGDPSFLADAMVGNITIGMSKSLVLITKTPDLKTEDQFIYREPLSDLIVNFENHVVVSIQVTNIRKDFFL